MQNLIPTAALLGILLVGSPAAGRLPRWWPPRPPRRLPSRRRRRW